MIYTTPGGITKHVPNIATYIFHVEPVFGTIIIIGTAIATFFIVITNEWFGLGSVHSISSFRLEFPTDEILFGLGFKDNECFSVDWYTRKYVGLRGITKHVLTSTTYIFHVEPVYRTAMWYV